MRGRIIEVALGCSGHYIDPMGQYSFLGNQVPIESSTCYLSMHAVYELHGHCKALHEL